MTTDNTSNCFFNRGELHSASVSLTSVGAGCAFAQLGGFSPPNWKHVGKDSRLRGWPFAAIILTISGGTTWQLLLKHMPKRDLLA